MPVPQLNLGPDEPLHVLVPSRPSAPPSRRCRRGPTPIGSTPPTGPPGGDAALAQVWVPRNGGAATSRQRLPGRRCPGCSSCSCSARARSGSPAGCPRESSSATPGARTRRRPRSGSWRRRSPRSAASRSSSASRTPGGGRSATQSLAGGCARARSSGAGDIGQAIGRMLAGFDVELTYVARTARDGVRSTDELSAAAAARRRRDPASSR